LAVVSDLAVSRAELRATASGATGVATTASGVAVVAAVAVAGVSVSVPGIVVSASFTATMMMLGACVLLSERRGTEHRAERNSA